ncbi:MAG: sigma-E processing peptidase SpoIIGA [Clostridia bacterium]|nr:sigma-E processing peptidase SpoIIGA [Clostridia bacterium]
MVVYIEYAFLENSLFDFALLSLSFLICKTKITWWKTLISACVGGVFAVIFPLILLPQILLIFLKIAVGFLLCFISFPRIKNKKEWGRYALNSGVFFFLTFLYGGALTALFSAIFPQKTPIFLVALGFALLSALTLLIVRKIYQKRTVFQSIYACEILYHGQIFALSGYLDSGNLASKNGVPVCFLSPDIFYDIFGEEILFQAEDKNNEGEGRIRDEMVIFTMSGERRVQLFRARIKVQIPSVESRQIEVYFTPSKHMLNREYQVLLNAGIIKG